MSLEDDLTSACVEVYRRAGEEAGYWATRFLQAVRRHGGLATVKRMLLPRTPDNGRALMRFSTLGGRI